MYAISGIDGRGGTKLLSHGTHTTSNTSVGGTKKHDSLSAGSHGPCCEPRLPFT
jgi:hypothetical protein